MRHVVGSILISKYRSWCTLTFPKCIKNGKFCQNATLIDAHIGRVVHKTGNRLSVPDSQSNNLALVGETQRLTENNNSKTASEIRHFRQRPVKDLQTSDKYSIRKQSLGESCSSSFADLLTLNGMHKEYYSAYKMLHSTETALLRVQCDITSVLVKIRAMLFVTLDLSSAFDMIDHEHLLYGIVMVPDAPGRPHPLCQDSLENTPTIPLQCDVPQGSALGPVMFTLHTTPMLPIFKRHGIQYHKHADDIKLYASYNPATPGDQVETARRLTDCIGDIQRWMPLCMVKLNDEKSKMTIFTSKHNLRMYGGCS